MANHTPGPWSVGRDISGYSQTGPLVRANHSDTWNGYVTVACVLDVAWTYGMPHPTTNANARLIAAAPELLEALQDLLAQVEQYGHEPECEAARAAIAKATGETK